MELTTAQRERLEGLLHRACAFSFDYPDALFTFSDRLARDNGWSSEYATRVEREYRRFACLVIISDQQLTPSDQVDQAWHLHLIFTRNYWGPWTELLGEPLHHGPTPGGTKAANRYRTNYEATKALYRLAFEEEPPADIWPSTKLRFDRPDRFVRLDTQKHIILKKPWSN